MLLLCVHVMIFNSQSKPRSFNLICSLLSDIILTDNYIVFIVCMSLTYPVDIKNMVRTYVR